MKLGCFIPVVLVPGQHCCLEKGGGGGQGCVVYFQFPKIFKRLVSAPTGSYSKIDMTLRRGLNRRINLRCYYRDLETRGPHTDHLTFFLFLEIAYKPPRNLFSKECTPTSTHTQHFRMFRGLDICNLIAGFG